MSADRNSNGRYDASDIDRYRRSSYGSRSRRNGSESGASDAGGNSYSRYSRSSQQRSYSSGSHAAQQRSSQRGAHAPRSQYVERQMSNYAPDAANYRGRAAAGHFSAEPAKPKALLPRLAIVAVLLIILIGRFAIQGGTFTEYNAINTQASEQQAQLDELTASNDKLQADMDSKQSTIDAWDKMHNR